MEFLTPYLEALALAYSAVNAWLVADLMRPLGITVMLVVSLALFLQRRSQRFFAADVQQSLGAATASAREIRIENRRLKRKLGKTTELATKADSELEALKEQAQERQVAEAALKAMLEEQERKRREERPVLVPRHLHERRVVPRPIWDCHEVCFNHDEAKFFIELSPDRLKTNFPQRGCVSVYSSLRIDKIIISIEDGQSQRDREAADRWLSSAVFSLWIDKDRAFEFVRSVCHPTKDGKGIEIPFDVTIGGGQEFNFSIRGRFQWDEHEHRYENAEIRVVLSATEDSPLADEPAPPPVAATPKKSLSLDHDYLIVGDCKDIELKDMMPETVWSTGHRIFVPAQTMWKIVRKRVAMVDSSPGASCRVKLMFNGETVAAIVPYGIGESAETSDNGAPLGFVRNIYKDPKYCEIHIDSFKDAEHIKLNTEFLLERMMVSPNFGLAAFS